MANVNINYSKKIYLTVFWNQIIIDKIEPFYPLEQKQLEVLLTHVNKERITNQDKKCLKIWYVWFDMLIKRLFQISWLSYKTLLLLKFYTCIHVSCRTLAISCFCNLKFRIHLDHILLGIIQSVRTQNFAKINVRVHFRG